jgi:hypothetical protein
LSVHLLEAITFDADVMIAHWKVRDEKNTLELVSMDVIITIMPYKLN